jgi:hypothetical protein
MRIAYKSMEDPEQPAGWAVLPADFLIDQGYRAGSDSQAA